MKASTDVLEGEVVGKTKYPYAVIVRQVKDRGEEVKHVYIEVLAANPKKARSSAMKIARALAPTSEFPHVACVDLSLLDSEGEPLAKRMFSYAIDRIVPLKSSGPMSKLIRISSGRDEGNLQLLPPPAAPAVAAVQVVEEPFNPVVITEEVLNAIAEDQWKYCKENFRKTINT